MSITIALEHRASPVSTTEDLDTLPQSIDDLDWDNITTSTITYAPRMERPSIHSTERVPTGVGWQEHMRAFLRPTAIQPVGSSFRTGRSTRQGGEIVPLGAKSCAPGVLAYALPRGVKRGDEGMRALDSWTWLPLDIDKAALPVSDALEIVEEALADQKFASYTTWSCRNGQASIRILIPLSRCASFDEVCSLWWWARRRLEAAGLPDGDYSSSAPALDPRLDSRLFYLPAVPRTGQVGEEGWGGVHPAGFVSDDSVPLLNVDAVLVEARELEAVDRPSFAERWPKVPLPGGSRRGPGGHTSSKEWTGSKGSAGSHVHTEWCDFGTVPFENTTLKAWAEVHLAPGCEISIGSPWREDGGSGVSGKSMRLHREADGRLWGKDFGNGVCYRDCVGLTFSLTPWTTALKTVDLTPEALTELLSDDEDDLTTPTEAVSQEEADRLEARRLRAEDDRRREREAERREQEEDEAQDLKASKVEAVRAVVDQADEAEAEERRRRLEETDGLPHAVAQSLDEDNSADVKNTRRLYDSKSAYHTSDGCFSKTHISESDFSTIESVVAELDKDERVGCGRGPSVHWALSRSSTVQSSSSSCYAFTCPRCGPRLLRATKAAGRSIFEPHASWPVVLLVFRGGVPDTLTDALHDWHEKSPQDRVYVGVATQRGRVEMLVSWNPETTIPTPAVKAIKAGKPVKPVKVKKPTKPPQAVSHEPAPTRSKWVAGPDGVEVLRPSGVVYDAVQLGEPLTCGLQAAYGEMCDRVDLKSWQEQTGPRAIILRGADAVVQTIIDLRDGGLRRLDRSSREKPKDAPFKRDGEVFQIQEDGTEIKVGEYFPTYSSTAKMLEAVRSLHFDVVPLDVRSDAGGTTVQWGQDPAKTAPEDLLPSDLLLDTAVKVSGAVRLVRKKRSAYARLERTLDDLYDDSGSSVFSTTLKVSAYKAKRFGEQVPSPRRFVALEEPVRPVAPEPAYKTVWSTFLGWKCIIFPGYDRLVLDEEGGASEESPCSVTAWADLRPSQRLAVVVREGEVGHLLLAWEEPSYGLDEVESWFRSSVSRAHQPPRWWDDVISEIGERHDSVESLFQTRFKSIGESKTA